ncbi:MULTISPECIES: tol-pal system-associated acyl-CoA thioesterase [unclassified Lysobacter]|uniref:tol-pal system-associated acyl-CoA thioesterase n=1 Tax=unclassified Lysobacter TaxID=2635362 RepID=UPI001BEB387E|nr:MULTISPECIES: tol-pal system-associated acyl-CoA thioesterase [unclassified Lysobacter]MBT2745823.1 tol-pal system-associated acyl-CoA thioesterase [Lysobacter sp. ISL-42]MBT2749618.1 tol-pal system-associated acyl-CoA thioesterase [Lysobacter sp. ISL-50]MBT2778738.1 tol-pal system-associated acyl-CoA thioesterase [Lysobacter sp. ISL-54]MBT2781333.1 tol-pal system-associated acyl-CoA thioesterase [Lysobacter sp. ISL-52]
MTSDSPLPIPNSRLFSWPTRVYWEDTDAGGVVYHAQYLAFLERARSEWVRALGYGQDGLRRDHGLLFVVAGMQIGFLKPARLDDALEVTVELRRCRRASLIFAQTVRRGAEMLISAEVRVAAVDAEHWRPCAIPPALLAQLQAQEAPGDGG